MAEHGYDDLARDLAALGRAVDVPAPGPGLATAVLERLSDAPAARVAPAWPRRRLVALAVGAVLLALLATPPVRAAVADWFGFGGVRVERGDTPTPTADPTPPTVAPGASLQEAAAMVAFTVSVPEGLGGPDGVEVSPDLRMVSMSWTTDEEGALRLDQFDATLDFSVLKTAPDVFYAAVNGTDALWFKEPHEVALLEPDGTAVTHSARLAGHTLIWQEGEVTVRLEGDIELSRAVQIAESAVPVDDRNRGGPRRCSTSEPVLLEVAVPAIRAVAVVLTGGVLACSRHPVPHRRRPDQCAAVGPRRGPGPPRSTTPTTRTSSSPTWWPSVAPDTVDGSGGSHESGATVTVTWMIHDVEPWWVDRIYLGGDGGPWIATQEKVGDDTGPSGTPGHLAPADRPARS